MRKGWPVPNYGKVDGIARIMIYPTSAKEGHMKAIKENKRESRYRCDFSMEWAYFNKIGRFDCTLLNYNKAGGYLESAMRPLPGSTIFMRLKPFNKKKPMVLNRQHPRSASLARVEWCRAISEKKQTTYGVGIKYFDYYGG